MEVFIPYLRSTGHKSIADELARAHGLHLWPGHNAGHRYTSELRGYLGDPTRVGR